MFAEETETTNHFHRSTTPQNVVEETHTQNLTDKTQVSKLLPRKSTISLKTFAKKVNNITKNLCAKKVNNITNVHISDFLTSLFMET